MGFNPGGIRVRQEEITLPFLKDDAGRAVTLVIRAFEPLRMLQIAKRLPGDFLETVQRAEEIAKEKDPQKVLALVESFHEGSVRLIEAGVVGAVDPETDEIVKCGITFDEKKLGPAMIDGNALSMIEITTLATRLLQVSGWGGEVATQVAEFRVRQRGRGPRGERAGDVLANGSRMDAGKATGIPESPAEG